LARLRATSLIIDAEVISGDPYGRPNFSALQEDLKRSRRSFGVGPRREDHLGVEGAVMSDEPAARRDLIRFLDNALAIGDEIEDRSRAI
jgi:hypothetical protein